MGRPNPLQTPAHRRYAPFYCEENVWHLGQDPAFQNADPHAVFLSNPDGYCALFHQAASDDPDEPVLWDYHVILIARTPDGWHVWDQDSTLPFPTPLTRYLDLTFQIDSPLFRVIPFPEFLTNFSSDRSHMLDSQGGWIAPKPSWPPIGNGKPSNLPEFIDAANPTWGTLLTRDEMPKRFLHRLS